MAKPKTRIYPVIHAQDEKQVFRNARIAATAGADGVFVIVHDGKSDRDLAFRHLIRLAGAAYTQIPWVGINFLGWRTITAIQRVPDWVSAIWEDNAGIIETMVGQIYAGGVCRENWEQLKASAWNGDYFGGVAFKYQGKVRDAATAAQVAVNYMDVVTTSGAATGQAADVEKIKTMRQAMPDGSRLAIASGITSENIKSYLPYATDFLVATGISRDFHNLDADKLHRLIQIVK